MQWGHRLAINRATPTGFRYSRKPILYSRAKDVGNDETSNVGSNDLFEEALERSLGRLRTFGSAEHQFQGTLAQIPLSGQHGGQAAGITHPLRVDCSEDGAVFPEAIKYAGKSFFAGKGINPKGHFQPVDP